MSDTRRKALKYLKIVVADTQSSGLNICPKQLDDLKKVVEDPYSALLSTSKFFEPWESWTKKEAWWFDLPIKKIQTNKEKDYYLLGVRDKKKTAFVIVKVPNKFLIEHLESFETPDNNKIRLHLAAYKGNWLVDERGKGKVDFSQFEVK